MALRFVNSCYVGPAIAANVQNHVVMFNWNKRLSATPRKQRDDDAARRLMATFPDRYLPDRPSLDGYTVCEVPFDKVAPSLFKGDAKQT